MTFTKKDDLINLKSTNKKIFIYGAGKNANYLYCFLKMYNITVSGFLVSSMSGNPDFLFNLPVIEVKNFQKDNEYFILSSITKHSNLYISVFNYIIESRLTNVAFLSFELMTKIREELRFTAVKNVFQKGNYHIGTEIPVETYHNILVLRDQNNSEYHWRFKSAMVEEQNVGSILELFPQRTILEEYEDLYGCYHILHSLNVNNAINSKSISIYMAQSHVDKGITERSLPQWIIPIQVGAALTEQKICDIRDNTGENISEKNTIYSECTALYWMWKNAPKTDYIGLCHYRRHFDMSENDFIRLVSSDIDVLVTIPTFVNETVHSFFSSFVPKADEYYLLKAIETIYPDYLPEAKVFLNAKFFPPCNLSIMKYKLFQEYAKYAFSITFEIERCYNELHFYRNDRYMGYLIEWLLGIFLMHHKDELKIAYTDMLFYS